MLLIVDDCEFSSDDADDGNGGLGRMRASLEGRCNVRSGERLFGDLGAGADVKEGEGSGVKRAGRR